MRQYYYLVDKSQEMIIEMMMAMNMMAMMARWAMMAMMTMMMEMVDGDG